MSRKLTPRSSLESLKREAKRWLKALRDRDPKARARLEQATPGAPADPTLRDVHLALAREHGFAGWSELVPEVARLRAASSGQDSALETLLRAADRGDAATVRDVLTAHPGIVNERGSLQGHGGVRTALHFAVGNGSHEVVDLLLAHGADPNIRDSDPRRDPGMTDGDNAYPLHFVAERGDLELVKKLIEHGADPIGADDWHELEVIGWATCFDALHREVAEYLLAHGARHTIHSAVAMGATDAIRDIVQRAPAELERPLNGVKQRRRPLHLAVVKKQPASLATLLALGADPGSRDDAGLTALDQAALDGEREMAQMLIDHGAGVELPAAVALGRRDDIERILREDPDCLRPGGRWERLIIRAAETASGEVLDTLVRAGASVHVRDNARTSIDSTHGYTALHAAAWRGNVDAIRALLRHGADPAARETKYWSTPVGWANYAGRTVARDVLLEGNIDIFDAIEHGRLEQIEAILTRDPQALERPFRVYLPGDPPAAQPWLDPAWTPLAYAVANGKTDAVRLLIERGANTAVRDSGDRSLHDLAVARGHTELAAMLDDAAGRTPSQPPRDDPHHRVAEFLRRACLDWRVGGSDRVAAMHDAGRMLARMPEIARTNIHTAVASGDLETVRRLLAEQPELASAIGGPRSWPPLLYLCSARLPGDAWHEHAVEIARLLLDHGAEPNVFYYGGNADIHYTALTCVLGRGEEQALMHPRARELTRLLLERGADPHDSQILYNVFADNTSRYLLDEDILWLLELMYEHSVRRGHKAQWDDPTWPMFDQRGAESLGDGARVHHGAHFMLAAAVDRNLLRLAAWMLEHGAGPNTPWGTHPAPRAKSTLYQEAVARGYTEMAQLLVRYGATPSPVEQTDEERFITACLTMDEATVRTMAARNPALLQSHRVLSAVVARDHVEAVALLLDLGMSPSVEKPSNPGETALHGAAAHGAERSAELLIARGADVDAREKAYGSTPLGWAIYFQQPRLIALLGQYSRDVWRLTYTGQVERLREVLREEPARARVVTDEGYTPLMWLPSDTEAALECARLLIAAGADPTLRNAEGRSAADIALDRGLDEVAAQLGRIEMALRR